MSTFPTFSQFHQAVTGHTPFPWQVRLADQVSQAGWPGRVGVPTGLGKTTSAMVAVYELARQAHLGQARTQPLRIVHVVDRRSIIDQTEVVFEQIRQAFAQDMGAASIVGKTLSDHYGEPLVYARLHGGAKTDVWVRPDVPTLLSTTSHQFVSRLLFRGFGVSAGMSPIHAGLLGVDTLVLFDEPHLSVPAITTILSAQKMQSQAPRMSDLGVPQAQLTVLGATLPPSDLQLRDGQVSVNEEDQAHPVAGRRLNASRQLRLVQATSAGDTAVIKKIISTAKGYQKSGAERIGIMVNDVAAARKIHDALAPKGSEDQAILITSRMRPVDRQVVDRRLATGDLPLFTVATQTLEAGVDVSFDALVTEICPLPSLIQRMGRLNRAAEHEYAEASLVMAAPKVNAGGVTLWPARKSSESIYGPEPLEATSMLLSDLASHSGETVCFSATSISKINAEHSDLVARCWPRQRRSATLHQGWSRIFTQTRPRPAVDIPVEAFVSGMIPTHLGAPEVRVVWRDDLSVKSLEAMPPRNEEILSLPIYAVRDFLFADYDKRTSAVPDTDDPSVRVRSSKKHPHRARAEVMQHKRSGWKAVRSSGELSTELLVLPTALGGYDSHGWNPLATGPVQDHGLSLALSHGKWGLITESTPGVPSTWWAKLAELAEDEADLDEALPLLGESLAGHPTETLELGEALTPTSIKIRVRPESSGQPFRSRRVTLDEHSRHVASMAKASAMRVGSDQKIVDTLEWAGMLHDQGKERPEFQQMLGAGGSCEPLAKSRRYISDPEVRQRMADRAGLERGWRHEADSALKAIEQGATDEIVHLVASHHGWARPLMVPGASGHEIAGDAARFQQLNDAYGPWGLAWMEAMLRLADHAASRDPEGDREAPRSTMPTRSESHRESDPSWISVPLPGLETLRVADWWAAFGMLSAAQDLYPRARMSFPAKVPTLHLPAGEEADQTALIEQVCAQIHTKIAQWGSDHGQESARVFPGATKGQKWDGSDPESLTEDSDFGNLMRSCYSDVREELVKKESEKSEDRSADQDDADGGPDPDSDKAESKKADEYVLNIPSVGPWWPHNSSRWNIVFKRSHKHGPAGLADVARRMAPEQFTSSASCGGITESWMGNMGASGMGGRTRDDQMLMIAYGVARSGLHNGQDYLGTVRSNGSAQALLPLPARPVDMGTLVALAQSIPGSAGRNWTMLDVPAALTATQVYTDNGKQWWWMDEQFTTLDGERGQR